MKAIVAFLIYYSLSVAEPVIQTNPIPVKENIFLTMERTPCFGKCPSYKIIIFNTGNVVYEGYTFADKEGKHTKKISKEQLKEIQSQMEVINLFELQDKYDSKITDLPSVLLYIEYKGNKKKILDRAGGPNELKQFEKLIDFLIIDKDLKKVVE
jgi:hypothetical protein